ncbi:MAG TPA: SDR family oxidoreductase [Solirubrobacteraceae bacterium]|nr:SDR family oxidoreductase [Solirubrobacteraceae bacterium]
MRGSRRGRDLSGEAVLVTGCSTGLGLETALHLAGKGMRVYATVRELGASATIDAAAAERGVTLEVVELDLTAPDSVHAAVETVVGHAGGIYGLVNNGGIGLRGCVEDASDAEIRKVFETNVFGTIAVTKAVLPHMRAARRGRIVTLSSVGGRISSFGVAVYCASKFAQEGLVEGLALEVAPFDVQAILVEPGIVRTTRWTTHRGYAARAHAPDSPYRRLFDAAEQLADRVLVRSKTTPDDVARAVHLALTTDKPRLRYVVADPGGKAIMLRRYLPERLFERVYFGGLLRQLQREPTAISPRTRAGRDPAPGS